MLTHSRPRSTLWVAPSAGQLWGGSPGPSRSWRFVPHGCSTPTSCPCECPRCVEQRTLLCESQLLLHCSSEREGEMSLPLQQKSLRTFQPVPRIFWYFLFTQCTQSQLSPVVWMSPKGQASSRGALVISRLCQRWRMLILAAIQDHFKKELNTIFHTQICSMSNQVFG